MIAGNAEFFLGLFIGACVAAILLVSIAIGNAIDPRADGEQYDPERLP